MATIVLGEGDLDWQRHERTTNRYGTVSLYVNPASDTPVALNRSHDGTRGRLVSVVLKTRTSTHIGDAIRGFAPETPEVGEEITLGFGELFFEQSGSVGLRPADGRDTDWLDPKALYRCHSQTVRLELRTP